MLALPMDCSRDETASFNLDEVKDDMDFGILVSRLLALRAPETADIIVIKGSRPHKRRSLYTKDMA